MATAQQFRDAKRAPFRPFRFRMVDGKEYVVEGPDWIALSPVDKPREVFYYAVEKGDKNRYETHRIDLGLVSEVILPPDEETSGVEPAPESSEA